MVEATVEGDGVVRNIQYAVWRTDDKQQEGYSRELVNHTQGGVVDWDAVL